MVKIPMFDGEDPTKPMVFLCVVQTVQTDRHRVSARDGRRRSWRQSSVGGRALWAPTEEGDWGFTGGFHKWDAPKNRWFIVENPKRVHYQWIGFDGTIFTGTPHDLHGKIHGFRWRFSRENQSIIVRGWDLRNHQNGEFTHWQLMILTGIEPLEPWDIKKLHGINYEQFTGKLLEVHTRMSSKCSVLLLFNLGTFLVICWILELKYSICCILELNLIFAGYLQHFGTRICMLESLIWTNFGAKIATLWSLNLRHVGPWKPWIAASWSQHLLHVETCSHCYWKLVSPCWSHNPWRIHGAAIYVNMDPINIPQSC